MFQAVVHRVMAAPRRLSIPHWKKERKEREREREREESFPDILLFRNLVATNPRSSLFAKFFRLA